jgi:hypothetical protein
MSERRTTFILRLEAKSGTAGIHALRFLLKRLLRQYGFVCLDARKEPQPISYSEAFTQAFTELRRDVAARAPRHALPHPDKEETDHE